MSKLIKQEKEGRALPKFGEWDVNNPASAEAYTVIFRKARDEKKNNIGRSKGSNYSNTNKQINHNNCTKSDEHCQHSPMVGTI